MEDASIERIKKNPKILHSYLEYLGENILSTKFVSVQAVMFYLY